MTITGPSSWTIRSRWCKSLIRRRSWKCWVVGSGSSDRKGHGRGRTGARRGECSSRTRFTIGFRPSRCGSGSASSSCCCEPSWGFSSSRRNIGMWVSDNTRVSTISLEPLSSNSERNSLFLFAPVPLASLVPLFGNMRVVGRLLIHQPHHSYFMTR
jgi:hypothetical protein